ncbi:MAG: transketolase family protein [Bacteroidetes bacterium]|nr:transketolase family protein [Bacteroidota bacterium]
MKLSYSSQALREVFGDTLVELGGIHKHLLVLDADLNTSSRTALFKQKFPDRFIQCGIAEANLFGIAAGLAAQGFTPFPSTFAAFATRKALDQIYVNIAYPNLDVKIAGSYCGMTATECGPSHNCAEDLAVMRSLPHLKVLDPGDNNELRAMMHAMMAKPGPVYFRVSKVNAPELFGADHRFEFGRGHLLRTGNDVTLVGTGFMTAVALGAATLLEREGISAAVVHMPSIKPIDEELLVQQARATGALLTIENHRVFGGLGGAVSEVLAREYPVHVEMLGLGDTVFEAAPLSDLLRHYQLTPRAMCEKAHTLVQRKRRASAA